VLRRFYPAGLPRLYGLSLLGAAMHLFLQPDQLVRVVLLCPSATGGPELAIVFIIDLALTGLLALPLVLAFIPAARPRLVDMSRAPCLRRPLTSPLRRRRHLAGAPWRARRRRSMPPELHLRLPRAARPHRWRGVLRQGNLYRVYLVHSLSGQAELKEEGATQTGDPRVERCVGGRSGAGSRPFFKAPVWRVAGAPATVSAYDLRFLSLLLTRRHVFE